MEDAIQLTNSNAQVAKVGTPGSLAEVRLDETRFPRYRNIPQPERLKWMAGEIKVLAELARIRDIDGKSAVLMAVPLDEMLMDEPETADLTLPEFHDAFRSGVFGKFGEFYGISAPNLYGFVRAFLGSEKKTEANRIVRTARERTLEERRRKEREAEQERTRLEIERAKKDGTFVPTGRAWYRTESVSEAIDSSGHRRRVEEQARQILEGEWDSTQE